MKKLIVFALLLAFVLGSAYAQRLRNGTFNGTAEGYEGPVTVAVTIARGRISAVEVTNHRETPAFANMAFNTMIPAMVRTNSAQVDMVSGATYTSRALIQAVQSALGQAAR